MPSPTMDDYLCRVAKNLVAAFSVDLDPAGHWITTHGQHVHISGSGDVDAGGNPHLREYLEHHEQPPSQHHKDVEEQIAKVDSRARSAAGEMVERFQNAYTHVKDAADRNTNIPVVKQVKEFLGVAKKVVLAAHKKAEERYGKWATRACFLGGALIGSNPLVTPLWFLAIPGSTLLGAAPLLAAAELIHQGRRASKGLGLFSAEADEPDGPGSDDQPATDYSLGENPTAKQLQAAGRQVLQEAWTEYLKWVYANRKKLQKNLAPLKDAGKEVRFSRLTHARRKYRQQALDFADADLAGYDFFVAAKLAQFCRQAPIAVYGDTHAVPESAWDLADHQAAMFATAARDGVESWGSWTPPELTEAIFQEQRFLAAREAGASSVRLTGKLPASVALRHAGWDRLGGSTGAAYLATGSRYSFAMGQPPASEAVQFTLLDHEAETLADYVLFDWNEVKHPRDEHGRFISLDSYVGKVYQRLKSDLVKEGVKAPTQQQLAEKVLQRMQHWDNNKFVNILGKSVQKGFLSEGIWHRQNSMPGENLASRTAVKDIAAQLNGTTQANPNAVFEKLKGLSEQEALYIASQLQLPVSKDYADGLAKGSILVAVNQKAGDTPLASEAAVIAGKLLGQGEVDDPKAMSERFKLLLNEELSSPELSRVASAIGRDAFKVEVPKDTDAELKAMGASDGQILQRCLGNSLTTMMDDLIQAAANAKLQQKADLLRQEYSPVADSINQFLAGKPLSMSNEQWIGFRQQFLGLSSQAQDAFLKSLDANGIPVSQVGPGHDRLQDALLDSTIYNRQAKAVEIAGTLKSFLDDPAMGMPSAAIAQMQSINDSVFLHEVVENLSKSGVKGLHTLFEGGDTGSFADVPKLEKFLEAKRLAFYAELKKNTDDLIGKYQDLTGQFVNPETTSKWKNLVSDFKGLPENMKESVKTALFMAGVQVHHGHVDQDTGLYTQMSPDDAIHKAFADKLVEIKNKQDEQARSALAEANKWMRSPTGDAEAVISRLDAVNPLLLSEAAKAAMASDKKTWLLKAGSDAGIIKNFLASVAATVSYKNSKAAEAAQAAATATTPEPTPTQASSGGPLPTNPQATDFMGLVSGQFLDNQKMSALQTQLKTMSGSELWGMVQGLKAAKAIPASSNDTPYDQLLQAVVDLQNSAKLAHAAETANLLVKFTQNPTTELGQQIKDRVMTPGAANGYLKQSLTTVLPELAVVGAGIQHLAVADYINNALEKKGLQNTGATPASSGSSASSTSSASKPHPSAPYEILDGLLTGVHTFFAGKAKLKELDAHLQTLASMPGEAGLTDLKNLAWHANVPTPAPPYQDYANNPAWLAEQILKRTKHVVSDLEKQHKDAGKDAAVTSYKSVLASVLDPTQPYTSHDDKELQKAAISLKKLTIDPLKQLAAGAGLGWGEIHQAGSNKVALAKAISDKLLEKHASKKAVQLGQQLGGFIDCSKKIYWGHAPKECGQAKEVIAGVASSAGKDGLQHVWNQLASEGVMNAAFPSDGTVAAIKKEMTTAIMSGHKEHQASPKDLGESVAADKPASTNTVGSLVTVPTGGWTADKFEALARASTAAEKIKDIGSLLVDAKIHELEPSWKGDPEKTSQVYGGVVVNDKGDVLLHKRDYGWTIPKGLTSSGVGQWLTAKGHVLSKTGVQTDIIGIVPGTYPGNSSNGNYLLMRPKGGALQGDAKWVNIDEARKLIAESSTDPARAAKEIDILNAGIKTYVGIANGGSPLPKSMSPFPDASELPSLKVVKSLGGSTGAKLVQDAAGNEYVRKTGANPGHLREEDAADSIYRAMGVPVPLSYVYATPDGPVKLSKYMPDLQPIGEYLSTANASGKKHVLGQARKHFVLDALLGNWDVVGLSSDNMSVDFSDTVYRIDNGGSLRYRAQGEKKTAAQFGPEVKELTSMRDPSVSPTAAAIFGPIADVEIHRQVRDILKNKDKILAAAPAELRPTLTARMDYLDHNYNPAPEEIEGSIYSEKAVVKSWPHADATAYKTWKPKSAELTSAAFKNWTDDEVRNDQELHDYPLSYHEHVRAAVAGFTEKENSSVESYTGSFYEANDDMRKCPETLDCLGESKKTKVQAIDSALAKCGTISPGINIWRHFSVPEEKLEDFLSIARKAQKSEVPVRIPGFKSCSISPTATYGFGEKNGRHVALEIKARTGALVSDISSHTTEKEFIQGHGVQYKVVGVKQLKYNSGYGANQDAWTIQMEEIEPKLAKKSDQAKAA